MSRVVSASAKARQVLPALQPAADYQWIAQKLGQLQAQLIQLAALPADQTMPNVLFTRQFTHELITDLRHLERQLMPLKRTWGKR
jgi:hypothetical protein